MEKNGIYIHYPFCLQHCPYCDFATVRSHTPIAQEDYFSIVMQEIENRNRAVPFRRIASIYFGGGTPSLADPKQIQLVMDGLRRAGFDLSAVEEVTLEANPGTLTPDKLKYWQDSGVNRFSVGAQTFDDRLLRALGREHSSSDTRKTLDLLSGTGCGYTVDLLFGVPGQTLDGLNADLDVLAPYRPKHISAYCLTLPERHPLQKGRAPEQEQVEMFYQVENRLKDWGLYRYEISNYTVPGNESVHNSLYWSDQNYWGLGMSSHSYFKDSSWGARFWNPPGLEAYVKQVRSMGLVERGLPENLPPHQREFLKIHQALTDFCHTSLRTRKGLSELTLGRKFPDFVVSLVMSRLNDLKEKEWVEESAGQWRLTTRALVQSDLVFQEMTFLESEL